MFSCSFLRSWVELVAGEESRSESSNTYETVIEVDAKESRRISESLGSCNGVTKVLDYIESVGDLLGLALLHVLLPFGLIEVLRLSVVVFLNHEFSHATGSLNHGLDSANNAEHDSKEPALGSSS